MFGGPYRTIVLILDVDEPTQEDYIKDYLQAFSKRKESELKLLYRAIDYASQQLENTCQM